MSPMFYVLIGGVFVASLVLGQVRKGKRKEREFAIEQEYKGQHSADFKFGLFGMYRGYIAKNHMVLTVGWKWTNYYVYDIDLQKAKILTCQQTKTVNGYIWNAWFYDENQQSLEKNAITFSLKKEKEKFLDIVKQHVPHVEIND